MEPQSLAVKRAEVEFHRFASLGEPERVLKTYAEENRARAGLIRKHLDFCGTLTPFLEIGANAGHTSYLLANEFGAGGFALDLSADALAFGAMLQQRWAYPRAPVRIAGDAARLPFRMGSLRFVMAWQMLHRFMDIDRIFAEVDRVLAPGGVFLFGEEPIRRALSLRLYNAPFPERMRRWERTLYDWGLLGYLAHDVIGAGQEEQFGIRLSDRIRLADWHRRVETHFAAQEYEIFVPERGWGERLVKRAAVRLDPYRSEWRAAKLLGGTVTAFCRKAGASAKPAFSADAFERMLACPDCGSRLARDPEGLACSTCSFRAAEENGVYNLLPSAEREQLYPGDRPDIVDMSRPEHASRLGEGWYGVEGVFGNKYRWIGPRATAHLERVEAGPQRLRVRGHAPDAMFAGGDPVRVSVAVNDALVAERVLDRPGMFVLEAEVSGAPRYEVEIAAAPVWRAPGDLRDLTVIVSLIRLISDAP